MADRIRSLECPRPIHVRRAGLSGLPLAYQGQNSLSGASQAKDTASTTAFIGFRPWDGTDIYINPEITQGFGLSDTLGVAGFPNFEAQKASFPMPRFDLARVYVQQTFGLGGEQETIVDGPNQIARKEDISRLTIIAGKLAVTDFFDNNAYAHDGRTQFFNWNVDCCGSYDWTMDQISYTWGAMAELNQKFWAFRAGYFLVPAVSNTDNFDMHFPDGEYIGELELRYSVVSQPGKLRLMAWANRANMGSYAAALAEPITTPNYPDITLVRQVRTNYGFEANLEQAITGDLGVFSRASWSPGLDEIIGWTDCDESLSAGAVLKGTSWGRPERQHRRGRCHRGPLARGAGLFRRRRARNFDRRRRAQLPTGEDLETYYSYSLNAWSSSHIRLSVCRRPRLQRRPGTGPYFCRPTSRRILTLHLAKSAVAITTRLAISGDPERPHRRVLTVVQLWDARRCLCEKMSLSQ